MNTHVRFKSAIVATAFAALLGGTACACAQASPGDGAQPSTQGGRPHHPPPEALAACENKAASDACSFTGRNNETVSGTCFAPPAFTDANGTAHEAPPLACRPEHAPSGAPPSGG
jgi:hypothetical protein